MNEKDIFETHPDLKHVNSGVEQSWFKVADALAEATFKVTGIWQDPQDNFWHENSTLLKHISKEDSQKIMDELESIHENRQSIDSEESDRSVFRAIGRGIIKGLRISGGDSRID